jgi:hypothetical protein
MYVSTNGGGLWTRRHNGVPNAVGTLPRSQVIRSANEFFVGLGNATNTLVGVYRTTNQGVSWSEFNNGVLLNSYTIRGLDIKTTGDTTIFSGAAHPTLPAGQGVFEYTWPPLAVGDPDPNLPAEFSLSQNYPNPFNPVTNISFDIPAASFVELSVFDVSGKEIMKLVNEQKTHGRYEVTFNAGNLSSGVYFYRLKAGEISRTMKMILVK